MSFAVVIATHGEQHWEDLASERALPSARSQGCPVYIGHDPDGTRASVRNELSEKVTQDWIITLDADDELAPGYVTAMQEATSAGKYHLLTPMVQYVRRGRVKKPKFHREVHMRDGNWMVVGTAVSRDLFMEVGGWRTFTTNGVLNQWDDWDLWWRCTKSGAGIVRVPDAVYIAHEDNLSPHRERSPATTQAWLRQIREANGG